MTDDYMTIEEVVRIALDDGESPEWIRNRVEKSLSEWDLQEEHMGIEGEERCECGEPLDGEIAEVVRDGRHVVVHVSCMREGEEIA